MCAVHYIYVQHSLVSLHSAYRHGAFDHYDTVCAAGSHHVEEIKAIEEKYNLPKKNIIKLGYSRFDNLIKTPNKNFNSKSINEIPNGIISLKGGDLKDELKDFKEKKIFDISEFFTDDFFKTKRVVYVPNLDN